MEILKFCGKSKKESVKKAVSFFYDNFEPKELQIFLSKCRVQKDGKTVIYYPNLIITKKRDLTVHENKGNARHRRGFRGFLFRVCQFFK